MFSENGVESNGAQPTIVRVSRDRRRFNQNVIQFSLNLFIYRLEYVFHALVKEDKFALYIQVSA